MPRLFKNIRFYVLVASLLLSRALYVAVAVSGPSGALTILHVSRVYALTALLYLYIALLIGPLVYRWHWLPYRGYIYRARRAVGVSTFYFASLHAYFTFFRQLGGFRGLPFLPMSYLIPISFSATALLILALMATTSTDRAIRFLTAPRWKALHRFVYLAGVLILLHAALLGTHFQNPHDPIPQLTALALLFLLYIEAPRVDRYLQQRFPTVRIGRAGTYALLGGAALLLIYWAFFLPSVAPLAPKP